MKKRLVSFLLSLVAVLALRIPASAGENGFVFGFDSSDMLDHMNLTAQELYDDYGLAVCFAHVPTLDGMTVAERAETFYQENIGDTDGILLFDCDEADVYYVYFAGNAETRFTAAEVEEMCSVYAAMQTYSAGINAYFNVVAQSLADSPAVSEEPAPVMGTAIPAERQLALVVDNAAVLSAEELAGLNRRADAIREAYRCDVALVFTGDTDGKGIQAYADDFYDYNGYGYGEGDDGVMLVVDVVNREYAVTTFGYGAYAFTDAGQRYVDEAYLPHLSNGNWSGAAEAYLSAAEELLRAARSDRPYDTGNMPKGAFSPLWIVVDLAAGFLLSLIPIGMMKKQLKTVVEKDDATSYVIPGGFRLTRSRDHFLYRNLNRTPRPKSGPGGGGGGSTMHISSSGRSHGGHSGSF